MFQVADIYTSSGATVLQHCWTPNVTKFDSSSFYHWEQDNEPVYDLEERTYLNWEQLGFPTSSVPGLALVVSGDATSACNSNVFTTVSAAVAALPQVLRFPVIIEIASFGELGNLNLDNIRIAETGSLEIINRNFAKVYNLSGGVSGIGMQNQHGGQFSQYNIISAVSSLDLSNTLKATSALNISAPVLSGAGIDSRIAGNFKSVWQIPGYFNGSIRTNRLAVSLLEDDILEKGNAQEFAFMPYEGNTLYTGPGGADQIYTGDCSTINSVTQGEHFRDFVLATGSVAASATGLVYGNSLSGIRVQNCDGPIYVRNFIVDGKKHIDTGVRVSNTNNLLLENLASVACLKNGFEILDSDVTLTRGIAAYRNYPLQNGARGIGDWVTLSTIPELNASAGVGLKVVNSHLNFSSTLEREPTGASANDFIINFSRNNVGIDLQNSVLTGGIKRGSVADEKTCSHFMVELNVDAGIKTTNSTISLDGKLQTYNNGNGIIANNSKIELDEFEAENNQHKGILANNTRIIYNKNKTLQGTTDSYAMLRQFNFSGNGQHLVLKNGTSFVPMHTSAMPENIGAMSFKGSHGLTTLGYLPTKHTNWLPAIELDNGSKGVFVHSKIDREDENVIGQGAGDIAIYGAALAATNNSEAIFQGSKTAATVIAGPYEDDLEQSHLNQKFKAGVYAGNNSKVEFNGPTLISEFAIDVLAEDNSVMSFNPHRAPQAGSLDVSGFNLWQRENHTNIELHSTRACLVANRGSIINMTDLGNYNRNWEVTRDVATSGTHAVSSGPDYITSSNTARGQEFVEFIEAGSMQFYPNPNDDTDYTESVGGTVPGRSFITGAGGSWDANDYKFAESAHTYLNYGVCDVLDSNVSEYDISGMTGGGTCVRALGGSRVNVKNVHFPCGFWNPSGVVYDRASTDSTLISDKLLCSRTFIWNIADTSYLHASYCSVSGLYPQDADYHGPSSVYGAPAPYGALYGAPSGTPDTSSLSVLDFYGMSYTTSNSWPVPSGSVFCSSVNELALFADRKVSICSSVVVTGVHQYGQSDWLNKGPFRIYVSVDPMANYLSSTNTLETGDIPQIFAQGYNFSGSMVAGSVPDGKIGPGPLGGASVHHASSIYAKCIRLRGDLTTQHYGTWHPELVASGFYYNNEMVDPTTYTRILLDESAANTFANAKNGAMGTSNRAQICTIYAARTTRGGESMSNSTKTNGLGYKSSNIFDLTRDN